MKQGTTICQHGTPTDEKCIICDVFPPQDDAAFWREECERLKEAGVEMRACSTRIEYLSLGTKTWDEALAAHRERVEKRMGK